MVQATPVMITQSGNAPLTVVTGKRYKIEDPIACFELIMDALPRLASIQWSIPLRSINQCHRIWNFDRLDRIILPPLDCV
jgi:hypothetical protein